MSQSTSQPKIDQSEFEAKLGELEAAVKKANYYYTQDRTWFRNLLLCYIHAITQSGYELTFHDNGAIKSIAPKGEPAEQGILL